VEQEKENPGISNRKKRKMRIIWQWTKERKKAEALRRSMKKRTLGSAENTEAL
jgi:hypothetical protein